MLSTARTVFVGVAAFSVTVLAILGEAGFAGTAPFA